MPTKTHSNEWKTESESSAESSNTQSHQHTKKRKRTISEHKPRKTKLLAANDGDIDVSIGIRCSFAEMDNHLLADYVAQRTRKHQPNLSIVELEDRHIAGISFFDSFT